MKIDNPIPSTLLQEVHNFYQIRGDYSYAIVIWHEVRRAAASRHRNVTCYEENLEWSYVDVLFPSYYLVRFQEGVLEKECLRVRGKA